MIAQFWLLLFACLAIGYGAGWFTPRIKRLGRVARWLGFGLLPFWAYAGVMATTKSTGTLREDFAWFMVGLMMLSPIILSWIVGFVIATMVWRRNSAADVNRA